MTSIKYLTKVAICFFSCLITVSAGVYKWTDENGKIHFSDKPHKSASEITIKTPKPSGIGTSADHLRRQKELLNEYQTNRIEKQERQRKVAKQKNKLNNYCKRLKNRIINYEDVDYLYVRDDNDKKKNLSRSQKKKEIEKLKHEYEKQCQ